MGLTFRGPLEPRSWSSYRAQPSGTTTLNRIGKPSRIAHGRGVVGYASDFSTGHYAQKRIISPGPLEQPRWAVPSTAPK